MSKLATIRRMITEAPSLEDFWTRIENLAHCALTNECAFKTQERPDKLEGSCSEEATLALAAIRRGATPATVRAHLAMALAWSVAEEEAAAVDRKANPG